MDIPIASASFEHCMILGCPHRPEEAPCNIPLPRQSPLGIYDGLRYQPMGEWPLTLLCLRHGRPYVCWPDSIHLEYDMRLPGQPVSPLWKIECKCAHEGCGKLHALYTGRMPNWFEKAQWILKTLPKVPCGEHALLWWEDLMRSTEIAHDPPMR